MNSLQRAYSVKEMSPPDMLVGYGIEEGNIVRSTRQESLKGLIKYDVVDGLIYKLAVGGAATNRAAAVLVIASAKCYEKPVLNFPEAPESILFETLQKSLLRT